MTLNSEERNTLVLLRLQRAKETLEEAKGNIKMKYWRTAANRLYYACYYAVNALLIKNGHSAHTHSGVISLFGLHFVSKGLISMEQGKLYRNLFEKRQSSDYDEWIIIEESDVRPFIEPAERFIASIVDLINN
ncbi:MAG: HEPN domain-containing protein [Prevotellaceae bacterium]|jgi:uncharacterized protein (UPF0332 family)|nr:HEPN domain-containing protein [Prevotellaceae bacterium]